MLNELDDVEGWSGKLARPSKLCLCFFWPGPGADSQGKADQDEPDNSQKGENQVAGARDAYDPEDHDEGGEEEVEEVDDDVVPDVE